MYSASPGVIALPVSVSKLMHDILDLVVFGHSIIRFILVRGVFIVPNVFSDPLGDNGRVPVTVGFERMRIG